MREINWYLWLSTMLPLAFSAGPGNLLVAASGARSGVRLTLGFVLGLDFTYLLIAFAIGIGLFSLVKNNPWILVVLKIAGSAYIVWLGIKLWNRTSAMEAGRKQNLVFQDGIAAQLANAQGWIMLVVMFSTFLPAGASSQAAALLSIALILLNMCAHALWLGIGKVINVSLADKTFWLNYQNKVFGLLLMLVGGWILAKGVIGQGTIL